MWGGKRGLKFLKLSWTMFARKRELLSCVRTQELCFCVMPRWCDAKYVVRLFRANFFNVSSFTTQQWPCVVSFALQLHPILLYQDWSIHEFGVQIHHFLLITFSRLFLNRFLFLTWRSIFNPHVMMPRISGTHFIIIHSLNAHCSTFFRLLDELSKSKMSFWMFPHVLHSSLDPYLLFISFPLCWLLGFHFIHDGWLSWVFSLDHRI